MKGDATELLELLFCRSAWSGPQIEASADRRRCAGFEGRRTRGVGARLIVSAEEAEMVWEQMGTPRVFCAWVFVFSRVVSAAYFLQQDLEDVKTQEFQTLINPVEERNWDHNLGFTWTLQFVQLKMGQGPNNNWLLGLLFRGTNRSTPGMPKDEGAEEKQLGEEVREKNVFIQDTYCI